MAKNRTGVHILANRAGLSYADTKLLLFDIMLNTCRAASAARTLAMAIGGDQHFVPLEHQGRRIDPTRPLTPAPDRAGD